MFHSKYSGFFVVYTGCGKVLGYTEDFHMDVVQVVLLVLLGAAVANCLDVMFHFTPRIADWLKKVFEQSA